MLYHDGGESDIIYNKTAWFGTQLVINEYQHLVLCQCIMATVYGRRLGCDAYCVCVCVYVKWKTFNEIYNNTPLQSPSLRCNTITGHLDVFLKTDPKVM